MKRIHYLRWSIAAAVAALLTFTGIRFFQSQREVLAIVKANLPPASKVRLSLSNGQQVLLANGQQQLQEAGGTTINASDTMIVYQPGMAAGAGTEMNILEVPRGHQARLVLADGTQVWVNADSRLEYPAVFSGSRREVKITGEAYFEVAQNAKQSFIVKANEMEVKVLGTAFNINTYDHQIHTTLSTGKVSAAVSNAAVVLLPGEQAVYTASALSKRKVDARVFTAWKDGDIYFEEASLKEIVHSLEREYDYTIHFDDPALERLHFTLDMRKTGALQDILDNIAGTTGKVRFKTVNRTIFVSKPEKE